MRYTRFDFVRLGWVPSLFVGTEEIHLTALFQVFVRAVNN